jgi:hypothetical protein
VVQIVSATSLLMQAFLLARYMAANHKQYVHAHLHYSKIQQMLLLLQQMLRRAVSTLMESHLLYTLMFHKITRIISTVQAAQLVPVNQVLL